MRRAGRLSSLTYKGVKIVPLCLMIILLSGISIYFDGIFIPLKTPIDAKDNVISFPECDIDFQDYTPCTDPRRWNKYGYQRLTFLERHCPPIFERKECLVPPPNGYKLPIRWPKSKNECWYRNVPYDWINEQKSNQNWLRKEGEKFLFPGGGTMFPNGVSRYVDLMEDLIPQMKDGTIRTAIDTGCGVSFAPLIISPSLNIHGIIDLKFVASWGGDLLERGILTMSLAPRDNHEAQVQFALERGIPAILGVLSTQRLPFPSNSFDIAHCSRCLIPWAESGGVYLMEIHRIVRPGGFWILSGPPVNYQNHWRGWNTTAEEQRRDYEKLQELLTSMCFKLYKKKDDIAVWRKVSDNSCYDKKLAHSEAYPPKCDDSLEPDAAWYTPLRTCVTVPNPKHKKLGLKSIPKWPLRLTTAPDRLSSVHGANAGTFKQDESKWKIRVKYYKKLIPALRTDNIRNVMDMNTLYGGFGARLIEDPVWVMNVVSSYGLNTLPVVYDRGLIGAYHDWCEPFSTYPRTYDLLHADGLFTAESHRCNMKYVLLEMDRILRPNGYAIIRENNHFVDKVDAIAKGMKWECRKEETDYDDDNEMILVCQKKLWYSKQSLK